ncbi:hypothetical protein T12_12659 [Trichinella patagoniensis]|uniref:FERM domain-containing protein n=1 Tax=Trichinella patagoniensis TaxID=990121 RepID=A0A0V0ZB09_9BILA|nr:hypothetical protein T12_12659 [Trichinella patagoniensis]
MGQGKICEVTIYSGISKIEMPIKSSTTGKKLLAAALAKLHLPKYDIFVLVDKQRRPLKMNVAVRKQVTRNDPTLKMITLYHSTELDEPLMLNDAFVAIQYVEAIENLICGKIIISYKNLIQLIAIAIHQNFLAPKGSKWCNISRIHWLRKRFRVSRKKWMSDIYEKIREHSFNNNIQAMKCFLIHAKNASTFSNQLLFTSNNYPLIGMNRKGIHFYIENNFEAYINWSQLISVKQKKRKVTVKYVEKQKLTVKIMFKSRGDAKSFVKFCKIIQKVEHLDATFYSFNPMNDWLESSSAESELSSKCGPFFIRRSLTAVKLNCETELFFLKMNSTSSSR